MSDTAKLLVPEGESTPALLERVRSRHPVAPGGANRARGARTTRPPVLPVLRAGPILRRSDRNGVSVWVATSAEVRVTGQVLDPELSSSGEPSGNLVELGRGSADPIQIGKRLFLTWITMTPLSGTFRAGRILAYDLTFHAPSGYEFSGGGLVERRDVTYGSLPLPTFILDAESVTQTHLMHGSCRKLHGPGRDATPDFDDHLGSVHNDAGRRPRMLLLTGDQIYADDVSADILQPCKRASRLLLGFPETLPGTSDTTDRLPGRTRVVREEGGLTVDADVAGHHLLGFGEYAAMYLLNWSPALWDAQGMQHPSAGRDPLPDGTARSRNYHDVVKSRRVLANVPTYMQLDDHEVSDDWPLDTAMASAIARSRYGKWIVANGLAACWLFQLQGNGLGQLSCLNALRMYTMHGEMWANVRGSGAAADQHREAMRGVMETWRTSYVNAAYRMSGLGSVTPTTPPVILLDTRTQRALTADGPPGLMNGTAREWLRNQFARLPSSSDVPLLIVSPAPVVGNPQFDTSQSVSAITSRYWGDREGWGHNAWYLRDFLRTLVHAGRKVVVFSGDVHFGYTATATFVDGATRMRMIQLTSSAIRNHPEGAKLSSLTSTAPDDSAQHSDLQGARLDFQFHRIPGTGSTLVASNNVGVVEIHWATGGSLTLEHQLRGEGRSGTVRHTL